MSLKRKQLDTVDAKARHVLMSQGKAPILLEQMSQTTRERLAAMVDSERNLRPDVAEQFRLVMVEHNETLKAVDAELE